MIDDAMMAAYRASLESQKIKIEDSSFKEDEAFIKAMIHYEIDLALFGIDEARKNLISMDPQAQFGYKQIAEAERMTEVARVRTKGAK